MLKLDKHHIPVSLAQDVFPHKQAGAALATEASVFAHDISSLAKHRQYSEEPELQEPAELVLVLNHSILLSCHQHPGG